MLINGPEGSAAMQRENAAMKAKIAAALSLLTDPPKDGQRRTFGRMRWLLIEALTDKNQTPS